jgi:hypothetical protein
LRTKKGISFFRAVSSAQDNATQAGVLSSNAEAVDIASRKDF